MPSNALDVDLLTVYQTSAPRPLFDCLLHVGVREMGGLSLADALLLCELLAQTDVARYERAALRWLQRFIEERLPPLTEVA